MNVYIDADVLLYETVFATTQSVDCGDGWWQTIGDFNGAMSRFKSRTLQIKEACAADEAVLCFSDKSSEIFRLGFFPEYKANRRKKQTTRPPHFAPLKRELLGLPVEEPVKDPVLKSPIISYALGWAAAVASPTLEADDLLSIYQLTNPGYIATIDKDLLQVPGNHIHLETLQTQVIHEADGYRRLMLQALSGDSTDNIPGIPRVGPVRAAKILKDIPQENMWDAVCCAYEDAGRTEEDAYMNLMLVRMLKPGEYDPETWEITMDLPERVSP